MINVGEGVLTTAVYGSATGLSMGGVFLFVRWMANFIAGRQDKKEAQIDAADERLDKRNERMADRQEKQIHSLILRVDKLEADLADCNRKHAEERAARMRLEALLQGGGDARQNAQRIIAADHLDAKKAKPKG